MVLSLRFFKKKMYSFAALCDKTRSERWFYDLCESYFAANTNASKATKSKKKNQTKTSPTSLQSQNIETHVKLQLVRNICSVINY